MLTATEGKSKSAVHSTRTVELSGPLSKLLTRSASRHGGYGWMRDLPDSRDFLYAAPLLLFRYLRWRCCCSPLPWRETGWPSWSGRSSRCG